MDDDFLDLFGAVANGFQAQLQGLAAIERWGLAPFQARTLSLIARNADCSQLMLSTWTGRDKAQLARTIKELEARGLVTRRAHPSDWRTQSLNVTAEGDQASRQLSRQRIEAGAAMLEDVSPDEREVLRRILSKMKARLDGGGGPSALRGS